MNLKDYLQKNKAAFDDKKMPPSARHVFEQQLKEKLHSQSNRKATQRKYLAIAASFGLLISLGYFYSNSFSEENKSRDLLVNAMSNETASTRLQAVYDFEEQYKKEDDRLLEALFVLIHDDGNNNVKIAAIDALVKFDNNEQVRIELIAALEKEREPLVQIKLIQSLSLLREQRASEPLQRIIDDELSLPAVKGNASLAITKLKT